MLEHKIEELLKKREFVSVGTCDSNGRPNAAPKFFLKKEGKYIYLVDYTIGRTWQNLKINPHVSLSLMDTDNLTAYQINGSVDIIESGALYDEIRAQAHAKEVSLSALRVIEAVASGKKHNSFEVGISDKLVIFKIKVEEISEIGPRGQITREAVHGA